MKVSDQKLKHDRAKYRRWLQGQSDRLAGKPCSSANGNYLDGWYAPDATIPDYFTHEYAAQLRRDMERVA